MANALLISICLYFYYYHISGLATTKILRLTAGNTLPVLSSQCRCDNCGMKITVLMQMPIFSYLLCRGRCRNCGLKLPMDQFLLELSIFFGMSLITTVFHFTFGAVTLSFLYYELIRILMIAVKGRRKIDFAKQYLIAVFSLVPVYLLTQFLSCLYSIV